MSALIRFINSKLKPYTTIIIALFMILLIILVSLYIYSSNRKPATYSNLSNVPQGATSNVVDIYFFYVDWCPHCTTAKPEWNSFKDNIKQKGGYRINCIEHNCTKDEDDKIKTIISEYSIESYPTIFIMKEGVRYDFDAKVTRTALDKFVDFVIQS